MNLSDSEEVIARYSPKDTAGNAELWTLTNRRFVVHQKGEQEHYPASKISAVKIIYSRSRALLAIGGAILLIAGVMEVLLLDGQSNLEKATLGQGNVSAEVAPRIAEATSLLAQVPTMQIANIIFAILGAYLVFMALRGQTSLEITTFVGTKTFSVNGRDKKLICFGEAMSRYFQ